MAETCPTLIRFCRIRVTLLDTDGHISNPPGNIYVSDNQVTLALTPEIDEQADIDVPGGCGCLIASAKGKRRFKRWQLELTQGAFEPEMLAMMLGYDDIPDGSDVIGVNAVSQLDCDFESQLVAFEGWTEAFVDDAPDLARPNGYFVWPATEWQWGARTLGNDANLDVLTGFSRSNANWGLGHGDSGVDVPVSVYAIAYVAEDPPTAACGAQSSSA